MFILYTNSVSAHQLPLARELVKRLGAENFRYVYTGENLQRGNQEVAASEPWIIRLAADESLKVSKFESLKVAGEGSLKVSKFESLNVVDETGLKVSKFESLKVAGESSSSSSSDGSSFSSSSSSSSSASTSKPLNLQTSKPLNLQTSKLLSSCDTLLVGGLYPLELMEARLAAGKKTLYMSERWFKPIKVAGIWLPGWLKLLHPGYYLRARRFAKMLRNPNYWYLPIGPWAAKDMRLVQRLTFSGCAANPFVPWGYFVAPREASLKVSKFEGLKVADEASLKVSEFESLKVADEASLKVSKFESLKVPGESSSDSSSSSASTSKPLNLQTSKPLSPSRPLRVLWVGRMLDWKRVDTLIRAVALANEVVQVNSSSSSSSTFQLFNCSTNALKLPNFQTSKPLNLSLHQTSKLPNFQTSLFNFQTLTLTLVGDGPEKSRLQKLASKLPNLQPFNHSTIQPNFQTFKLSNFQTSLPNLQTSKLPNLQTPKLPNLQTSKLPNFITFLPPVPIDEVRNLMREHDIYVLPSSAYEGWGAALSEAMTEEMTCLGTFEAGASAALLPYERLFHAGDYKALAKLLTNIPRERTGLPYDYTPEGAARRLLKV